MILGFLIAAALVTATISGAIGMGGGIALLAVMATLLPPALVVPIHGVVQLTSNLTRTLRLLDQVVWKIALFYVPPMILGVGLGLQLYRGAGMPWFRPAIGLFVLLFLFWDRIKPKRLDLPLWVFIPAGLVGGLLTILIGASGPFLAAFFLRDDYDRKQIVATKAMIQTFGHLVKIPAFLSIQFAYHQHLDLILPLIVCAIAGTFLGTWALAKMGDRAFRVVFRVVLGGLAIRLLLDAVL